MAIFSKIYHGQPTDAVAKKAGYVHTFVKEVQIGN